MTIWQDLVDEHGFSARYASVRRFVGRLRGHSVPEVRVVIMTAPAEEGQVDYGDGPRVRDAATGKYRRTRLFVLTLGYAQVRPPVGVQESFNRLSANRSDDVGSSTMPQKQNVSIASQRTCLTTIHCPTSLGREASFNRLSANLPDDAISGQYVVGMKESFNRLSANLPDDTVLHKTLMVKRLGRQFRMTSPTGVAQPRISCGAHAANLVFSRTSGPEPFSGDSCPVILSTSIPLKRALSTTAAVSFLL